MRAALFALLLAGCECRGEIMHRQAGPVPPPPPTVTTYCISEVADGIWHTVWCGPFDPRVRTSTGGAR